MAVGRVLSRTHPPASASLPGTPYELGRRLGAGASGEVFLATHSTLNKPVAIKLLREELARDRDQLDRLRAEARILARLNHPSLVGVYDLGEAADGRTFFVMEYVEGRTLRDMLQERRPWPVADACDAMALVLDGLAAAHDCGVVHRDVKPSNVIVGTDGRARLVDFGVARLVAREGTPDATRAGMTVGTPGYMAPEQASGEPVTAAADLYAAGCVLFELLTGSPPFRGGGALEVMSKHVSEPSPTLAERADGPFDTNLEAVIAQALAKDPGERPRSARSMAGDLRRIAARARGEPTDAKHETSSAGRFRRAGAGTLQEPPTRFFGREREMATLQEFCDAGDRIVTILGPGGCGKTRLAKRFASVHAADYARHGGTWFVDLTQARDEIEVVTMTARTLEIDLRGRDTAADVAHLASAVSAQGPMLVVIDNCEQVAAPLAEFLGRLSTTAPDARFVATSRERLGVSGERSYELEPLSMPVAEDDPLASAAVQLFVDRARLVRPGFAPDEEERRATIRLVRALDGMPLAIELAAGRMGLMNVTALVDRLEKRFDLLASTARDLPVRQTTLQAAIDSSWDLLEPWERTALCQCAVFRGGFTVEAAEAVVDLGSAPGAPTVLQVVQRLRDKSLVYAAPSAEFASELRLGLYESIREYALRRLAESGQESRTADKHTEYFLHAGERWVHAVRCGSTEHLRRLALELENLRAVHARALASSPHDAMRAALVLDRIHIRRSPPGLHVELLSSTLAAAGGNADATLVARLLLCRSTVLHALGDNAGFAADAERALELARQVGERALEGEALYRLAIYAMRTGRDPDPALDGSLEAFRAASDRAGEARALTRVAVVRVSQGRAEVGRDAALRAVALAEADGDADSAALARLFLGIAQMELGELAEAERAWEESRTSLVRLGHNVRTFALLLNLASVRQERGDHGEAERTLREIISNGPKVGLVNEPALARAQLGVLHAARDDVDEAKRLLDDAAAILAPRWDVWVTTVDVHRGHLDLALARKSALAGDAVGAAAHRAAAHRRLAEGKSKASASDDLRTALRWLDRAVDLGEPERYPLDAWVVSADGAWFRPPRAWRIDVGARRHLRAVFCALLESRIRKPGATLSTMDLLSAGWPGERVLQRAGVARVYSAIKTLRDIGLRELIASRDAGYLLDPAQRVVVAAPSTHSSPATGG